MKPERVIELSDPAIGLQGFVVIHTTAPGPAFGGCRVIGYDSPESCRADAIRLAEAMTYKFLINGMPGGGGKIAVMRGAIRDRRAVMHAIGDAIEALDGSYYSGPDSGLTPVDLAAIAERTSHVATEDLGPAAADGVVHAIRATAEHCGVALDGMRTAIQGLGAVGLPVASALIKAGGRVVGADVDAAARARAKSAGVELIEPGRLLHQTCELWSPCGLGGVLNRSSARRLDCKTVVGAANNQLADGDAVGILHARGIVFVPDFLANSGAAIRGAWRQLRGTPGTDDEVAAIYDTTLRLLRDADRLGRPPWDVAMDQMRQALAERARPRR